MSQRREFIILGGAGLCLLAAPFTSLAQQQGNVWRVGFLSLGARPASLSDAPAIGAFLRGMRELGYIEGKNLVFEGRWADNKPKRLEMLLEMVPKLSRVAYLVNPSNPANIRSVASVQAAAQTRRVEILRAEARTPLEIDHVFSLIRQQNAGALLVALDPLFTQQRSQIAELAAKNRLPSVFASRAYAEAGGLMSYGPNAPDQYRRAATYVDKIFKGAKPADLPVEQPTRFELVINGRTAKALGLTIPQSLLITADKVIE